MHNCVLGKDKGIYPISIDDTIELAFLYPAPGLLSATSESSLFPRWPIGD